MWLHFPKIFSPGEAFFPNSEVYYKKHHNIIQNIPFELESIIEYLREEEEIFEEEDQENEDNIYEYEEEEIYEFEEEEEEEEEFEEDDENGTDDETMNPY